MLLIGIELNSPKLPGFGIDDRDFVRSGNRTADETASRRERVHDGARGGRWCWRPVGTAARLSMATATRSGGVPAAQLLGFLPTTGDTTGCRLHSAFANRSCQPAPRRRSLPGEHTPQEGAHGIPSGVERGSSGVVGALPRVRW
jgi:hypothetical protein